MDKGEELKQNKRAYRNLFVKEAQPAGPHLYKWLQKELESYRAKAETYATNGENGHALACINSASAIKRVVEHIDKMSK